MGNTAVERCCGGDRQEKEPQNMQKKDREYSMLSSVPAQPMKKEDYAADLREDHVTGDYLRHVPLLAKLSPQERNKLGGSLKEKSYNDKEYIIRQGDIGDSFYIIKSGTVAVSTQDHDKVKEHARLARGDYFGEAALLSDAKRNASIQAVGPVSVWFLERKEFQDLIGNDKVRSKLKTKRQAISSEDQQERMRATTQHQHESVPSNATKKKEQATVELIMEAVQDNLLFSDMLDEHKRKIIDEMYRAEYKAGQTAIRQGERGDHLFVIESGEFKVFVNDVVVATRGKGTVFGELALLYNAPRAATVTAAVDSIVWIVDRYTFRQVVQDSRSTALSEYTHFLNQVELLRPLSQYDRDKIAEALEEKTYAPQEVLIKQGEFGDCMYIVHSGELVVVKREQGEKEEREVGTLKTGDVFGERALLKNEVRAATVISKTHVVLLKLSEEAFRLILGPLEEIMKKKVQSYDSKSDIRDEFSKKDDDEDKKIKQSDLVTIGTLGKGSFGHVSLVRDKNTDKTYALKAVSKQQIVQTGQQGHIMSEKRVMQQLKHPFLIRLYATYKDKDRLLFLLEPSLGGELFSVLRARTSFDEETARFYAASVVLAFEYMHSKNIIYRDLKPENLLLDAEGYLKVTDFGFAKELTGGRTWTLCGTPDYLAPEIVAGKGHGKGVDWWTLGVFIYEMLASYPPFYDEDPMKTYAKIIAGNITFPPHFSKEAISLISKLLHHQPTKRLGVVKGGAKLIKRHAWFSGFDWDGLINRKLKPSIIPKIKSAEDMSNFDEYPEEQQQIEPYEDDGSNWDADF